MPIDPHAHVLADRALDTLILADNLRQSIERYYQAHDAWGVLPSLKETEKDPHARTDRNGRLEQLRAQMSRCHFEGQANAHAVLELLRIINNFLYPTLGMIRDKEKKSIAKKRGKRLCGMLPPSVTKQFGPKALKARNDYAHIDERLDLSGFMHEGSWLEWDLTTERGKVHVDLKPFLLQVDVIRQTLSPWRDHELFPIPWAKDWISTTP